MNNSVSKPYQRLNVTSKCSWKLIWLIKSTIFTRSRFCVEPWLTRDICVLESESLKASTFSSIFTLALCSAYSNFSKYLNSATIPFWWIVSCCSANFVNSLNSCNWWALDWPYANSRAPGRQDAALTIYLEIRPSQKRIQRLKMISFSGVTWAVLIGAVPRKQSSQTQYKIKTRWLRLHYQTHFSILCWRRFKLSWRRSLKR